MKEKKDKKEQENTQVEDKEVQEKTEEKKPAKTSKNKLLTWILLTIGILVVLTIAVLIGLKLQGDYNAKNSQEASTKKEVTPKTNDSKTTTTKPLTKEELLIQAFYYPNTTKVGDNDSYDFVYYTNDSVTTAYNYYEELINLNNWELGPSGMATDISGGFLYVYQDDFTADIEIRNEYAEVSTRESSGGAGSTEIDIRIYNKEEVPLTSTLNRPNIKTEEPTPPSDAKIPQSSNQNEYVLPFSNSRKIVRDDLTGLTEWQLKVARNEIYARHGRSFVHQDLSCYFKKQSWYEIDPNYTENKLSSLETSNAVFILNYEKEINSLLINKDTGCK